MCQRCSSPHDEFIQIADLYNTFNKAPEHGNVLLIACGDEKHERLIRVRQLHAESFSGEHAATMTHAGGPLAFEDPMGMPWLVRQVMFFIEHKNIDCVHLCVHTDCGWAKVHNYSWNDVESILMKVVVPVLQKLITNSGNLLKVVATIYAENGKLFYPRLLARAA